uniref:Thionin-like protein 2 n=1 Tax=Cajanus cajan TaxID=3821 RepID=A0A151QU02_CAJCA|nr:hypothetical protein KK1_045357 [Cajanus cajan]
MAKNEIKTIKVVIMVMIMMGFAQANHNPPLPQIDPNNMLFKGDLCSTLCTIKCAFTSFTNPQYNRCIDNCIDICYKKHVVYNCITSCGLTKSIDNNIDARGLPTHAMDSCFQKCLNK